MKSKLYTVFILVTLLYPFCEQGYSQIPEWSWARRITPARYSYPDYHIATDTHSNIYTIGNFEGTEDFDPGPGVYNLTAVGDDDIFICKLDSNGIFIWAKSFGGSSYDEGRDIAVDASDNVYITGGFFAVVAPVDFDPGPGVFNLFGSCFISKFDSSGNFIWAKSIAEQSQAEGTNIVLDDSGNVYNAGTFIYAGDFDPGPGVFTITPAYSNNTYILKLDSSGNFKWAGGMSAWNDFYIHSLALDSSNNVYATGCFRGKVDFDPGPGTFKLGANGKTFVFVTKLTSSGNFAWAKIVIESHTDPRYGRSIVIDKLDNLYISGGVDGHHCDIMKYNNSGVQIWSKTISNLSWGWGYFYVDGVSLAVDSIGNSYIVGRFVSQTDFDPNAGAFILDAVSGNGTDMYVCKLDSAGNFLWAQSTGGTDEDQAGDIALDNQGNLVIAGNFASDTLVLGNDTLLQPPVWADQINFLTKIKFKDCSAASCNFNAASIAYNVTNSNCNNGIINVSLNGSFEVFPHIELYNSQNVKIRTCNLNPDSSVFQFTDLTPDIYTVKVFDLNCCEHDTVIAVRCGSLNSGLMSINVTPYSAKLIWNTAPCVLHYKVQYRVQGASAWTNKYTGGSTGSKEISGLTASTIYEWRVGNSCIGMTTYPLYTFSPIQSFVTPSVSRGNDIISNYSEYDSFEIYLAPNPATYMLTVKFECENTTAHLKIINTVGRLVIEKELQSDEEGYYEKQLDISNLSNGVYMVMVEAENVISYKKFIRE